MSSPVDFSPYPPLIVFFGTTATGKSTLAKAWADRHGFLYFNSDVVRKELAGEEGSGKQPVGVGQGIYTPEFSRRTYDELLQRAKEELTAGKGVVLDASYLDRPERDRVLALADRLGVTFRFVLCECSDHVRRQRLDMRARDPQAVSDGRWEIYLRQREKFEPPFELPPDRLILVDTAPPVDHLLMLLDKNLAL